ncbi:MAG: hypothetical protein D3917_11105 [Candidatus Electrothrix sp. AX5]|jgi:hypothetical protein|uniref:Uncharacterized protein n=1 Tax=Candidatus Electrothrix aarhusensis TaxID=1859131 RepID=A0A3S3UCU9_9BACT|nr:hypothetical protein [Candidatus Electrothrix sp. AX5]RWX47248.1 hypothetical protein H206_02302 [Candidatus Electrothrix aarhusensis]
MRKKNCWEVKKCGRQPGGNQVDKQGICPASTIIAVTGINNGINGGRACWALTGTMSGPAEKVQGSFARTLKTSCYDCNFYEQVMIEEQEDFEGTVQIVEKLKDLIAAVTTQSD